MGQWNGDHGAVVALLDDDSEILQPGKGTADDMPGMTKALEQLLFAKLLAWTDAAKDDVILQLPGDALFGEVCAVLRGPSGFGPGRLLVVRGMIMSR